MIKKLSLLISVSAALAACHASAVVISQSTSVDASGGANYGQRFVLDSSIFTQNQTLDSITLYKGHNGGGASSTFLDIYEIGTANLPDLNFATEAETANLTFLGSSTNSINYTAATGSQFTPGDALVWNFSGITLNTDIHLFAVLSSDSGDGNYLGASFNIDNSDSLNYTNITDINSDPLFNSDAPGYDISGQDNYYSISMTAVPEPSTFALIAVTLGGLMALRRRRA